MDQYTRYHKKPYSTFLTMRAFNEEFGTNMKENAEYEAYFKSTFDHAKKMQGPDDFLQVTFARPDQMDFIRVPGGEGEYEEMGLGFKERMVMAAAKAFLRQQGLDKKKMKEMEKKLKTMLKGATASSIVTELKKLLSQARGDLAMHLTGGDEELAYNLKQYMPDAKMVEFIESGGSLDHFNFEEMGMWDKAKAAMAKAKEALKKSNKNKVEPAAPAAVAEAAEEKIQELGEQLVSHLDEYEEMGAWDKAKAALKAAKDKAAKLAKAANDKLESITPNKAAKDKAAKLAKAANDKLESITPKLKPAQQEFDDLDELLSDEEELEEEYEEESIPVPTTNIVTEKKKITDIVMATSVDSDSFSQDMKHLIRFKQNAIILEDQLMKGRPKYLKALKAYVKGNKDVEVKMSWKKGQKMVKVSDLNPKIESLKALLRSQPGEMRVVQCL
jgi:organic radical activating enzyme